MQVDRKHISTFKSWREDWNRFAHDVLKARLDQEQQDILSSFQYNKMTAVASGTARGKDYVAACCALSFFYLTPVFGKDGALIGNTKVILTGPTGRQVSNICTPEVRRLLRNAKVLPGRLVADDIRTDYEEWFLTGFKADENNHEAWSGLHAVNIAFIVTEATGVPDTIFNALEGNLQGNSRILLVFNPNVTTGYAANAMKSPRFHKFRLNSLNAENVVTKKDVIPGQVNYEWVYDKVLNWCTPIQPLDYNEGEGDFQFEVEENGIYVKKMFRPNDLFRVKVLGMFPKVAEDVLIPYEWIELANRRWELYNETGSVPYGQKRISADIAGMGRDSSVRCVRVGNYVEKFYIHQSAGKADHMHIAGMLAQDLNEFTNNIVLIDSIGEGAGVLARLEELGYGDRAVSAKFSYGAKGLTDATGHYSFVNQRAYCYWCVRDWLNPKNNMEPCLPPDDLLLEELTSTKWKFNSSGAIQIEPKEEIQKNLKRSPDRADALALNFFPNYSGADDSAYDTLLDML